MPPLAIAAGVAAVGSVAGGALAASGAKKAAKTAAASAAADNALQQQIYGQNTQNLSPFMQRGNVAGDTLNALLGLPATNYQQPQAANNNGMTQSLGLPSGSNIPMTGFRAFADRQNGTQGQPTGQQQISAGTVPGMTQDGAQGAFRSYLDNSDYAFRQNEGDRGLNAGYAARGMLESGAAMKALEKYRQNLQAGYRNEYMGYLGNQQGVGLSGANALAGVGTNYANNVNANNQGATGAAINAGLIGSSAIGNGLSGAANAIGSALGSSYGGGVTVPGYGLSGGTALPMPGYGNALSAWG